MNNKLKIPYEIKNEVIDDTRIITLSGTISKYSYWSDDVISAKLLRDELDEETKNIVIRLNSGGGDVFEGIEIYNYLKDHQSHITVEVVALAGSAASIICMGADKIIMKNGSSMMIHEASTFAYGNKGDIQKVLNALETIDDSLISIYALRTGKTHDEIKELLKSETWFTAEEAVESGFADEVLKKEQENNNVNTITSGNGVVFNLDTGTISYPETQNKNKLTALQRFFLGGQHDN